MKLYLPFILSLVIISGCDNSQDALNLLSEEISIEYHFCPVEDCESIFISSIHEAKISVFCALYDLDSDDLINELSRKSKIAEVRIVIDAGNYQKQIKGNGIKLGGKGTKMHNKFCVIDGEKVITGSTNPTNNGFYKNNNNILIVKSLHLAENFNYEFKELWEGIYSGGGLVKNRILNTNLGIIENYFCPEDCSETENGGVYRVIDLIRGAKNSINVASFSFTHEELADELVKSDIRGLNVSILTESRQRNGLGGQYTRLRDFGLNIKVDGNKHNMHHKFIIIDGSIVILGSPNFTLSGNNRNDENMLIIFNEDIAREYEKEYIKMFSLGKQI
jgi:phosphatidylserine/phosphatidylglycerophosphate/cardiolipin synthase-like enzyme